MSRFEQKNTARETAFYSTHYKDFQLLKLGRSKKKARKGKERILILQTLLTENMLLNRTEQRGFGQII